MHSPGDRSAGLRIGFGAMRLTGFGAWGPPPPEVDPIAVLRAAVDLGVTLIDTSDAYGPHLSEEQIRAALHPYPDHLLIVTKGGQTRTGPTEWAPVGRPEYLLACAAASLRRLGLESLPLYLLHRPDPQVPFADQVGALAAMKERGWAQHVGLSNVTVAQVAEARAITPIAAVQNRYNLAERDDDDVVDYCESHGIAYLAWFPVARGALSRPDGSLPSRPGPPDPDVAPGLRTALADVADRHGATAGQISLAWLLQRAKVIEPIPGTSRVDHLRENVEAAQITLSPDDLAALVAA
jgi:aryl-alcohol dehydrogenase-like predicted oxidoreductase